MVLVISPGVCHGEGLQDPADRLAGLGLQEEMEMVPHQAVTEHLEGIASLGEPHRLEKAFAVAIRGEDIDPVVTAIQRVID